MTPQEIDVIKARLYKEFSESTNLRYQDKPQQFCTEQNRYVTRRLEEELGKRGKSI